MSEPILEGKWLLGESGLQSIRRIKLAMKTRLVGERFGKQFTFGNLPYSPWMQLGEGGLVRAVSTGQFPYLETAIDRLNKIADLVQGDSLNLEKLGIEHSQFEVFHDIAGVLPDAQVWLSEIAGMVLANCPWLAGVAHEVVDEVIPIRLANENSRAGFGSSEVRGVVFLSVYPRDEQFGRAQAAVDFIHEVGHQALLIYQAADPLVRSSSTNLIYSGIKKMPRPPIMALHGAVALSYMLVARQILFRAGRLDDKTWAQLSNDQYADLKDLNDTLTALNSKAQFTQLGRELMDEMWNLLRLKE